MNIRRINEILGYAFFIIGASKIILMVLVFVKLFSNMNSIFAGGEADLNYYSSFSITIGFAQLILGVVAIIMIILNIKVQPEVITGYVWSLGALLFEFIMPSSISMVTAFVSPGMYMKAGSKIKSKNLSFENDNKPTKQMIKNTDWFYSIEKESKEEANSDKNRIQEEKRRIKLEKEIEEWKQLLDSGEIDEETYNEETNKLIEKERRKSKRNM